MSVPSRYDRCPNPSGRHLYGASKRLICDSPAPPCQRSRGRLPRGEVDRRARLRPGAFVTVGRHTTQNDGIEDVAGWGEDGDPWTS